MPVPELGVALDGVLAAGLVDVGVVVGLVVVGLVVGLVAVGLVVVGVVVVGVAVDGEPVDGDPPPVPPPPVPPPPFPPPPLPPPPFPPPPVGPSVPVICWKDGAGNADVSTPFAAAGTVAYAASIAELAVAHALLNVTRSFPNWFSNRIRRLLSSIAVMTPFVSAPRTVILRPLPQPMLNSFVENSLRAATLAATAATTASGTDSAAVAVRSSTSATPALRA
ncbi:hypothetical protein DVB88_20770 [Tsukamurella pulmonis]|nr:hypothetical protein DVB88_20770 [Tsukamurella pulmonis]